MKKIFLFCLLLLGGLSTSAWASCSFDSGYMTSQLSMSLPATISVPADATPGTELWSSGWVAASGNNITCNSNGSVSGVLAAGIGAAVPGFTNSSGYPSVFKTNIEGIGISVYWCNYNSCNPNYNNVTPIPSLAWSVTGVQYPLKNSWWVRLVKTGPILNGGQLQVSGTSTVSYQNLAVARLTFSGATAVTSRACEINPDSQSITVPLPTVLRTDFPSGLGVLADNGKARAFSINMQCDSGVKIWYRVDGASSGNNVLDNATGAGMASGVGVQLFYGDASSTQVLPLATKQLRGSTGSATLPVSIPLAAKYYKTASTVTGGQVAVTATFTLTYE
ncbi:Pilin (type 1 fimbria component protein) [Pseudomonas delhiensis]|uniref:Pilin (Type 1 fimbria component protein) n=1 Tax=Pseudomonas delhiensis TaxID=366289 RepID=A0A239N3K6_9PSED|nr:fimbrial protein [Pseudomonas delhiensis]SDK46582.1 Pilin (type 1 fimbria component protein) [Pseudomonas delhiensis]SNT49043.1 Pilin (type 1 fimbria component protein) [Pseudomonas delhiensis]